MRLWNQCEFDSQKTVSEGMHRAGCFVKVINYVHVLGMDYINSTMEYNQLTYSRQAERVKEKY